MCTMLVLGDMFCAPDLLKPYSAEFGWEGQLFIDREVSIVILSCMSGMQWSQHVASPYVNPT